MKIFKVHFTSDVWESIEIEANNTNEAKEKFHKGEWDQVDTEEHGKENLKVDTVEKIK